MITGVQDKLDPSKTIEAGFLGVSPTTEKVHLGPAGTLNQMWTMTSQSVIALGQFPVRVWNTAVDLVTGQPRDVNGPMSIVGASRVAGEVSSTDQMTGADKVATFFTLLGNVNLFVGLFNLVPLLPLDGGHILGVIVEWIRRQGARIFRRPDPGFIDTAKMLPVAYAVFAFIAISGGRPGGSRHLLSGHPVLSRARLDPSDSSQKEAPMAIDLPAPQVREEPPPVVAPRRVSRQIRVGDVLVGGDAPISVQSMTTTQTTNVNATLQQIAQLTAAGCDIVRVAVPSQDDAEALPEIAKHSQIPVIADIHFNPRYVFAAIDAGCAAVRVNPGNIKAFDDKVADIAKAATDAGGVSLRIGVNAGSLDKRLLAKYGSATPPEALVESALWEASLFEEVGFRDFKISVKHHDPVVMIKAYQQLAAACDYPLHLGVTEAGPAFQGTIKSATAFGGALLSQGIGGDTIRVSLSADPVEEVKVGTKILESLNLRPRKLEIVSCPSCGRAQVDVYTLAEKVTAGLEGLTVPLRVAVMGCVVNGPGEAREADLGVASGNGKGQIFVHGEVIKTVKEADIVETLIEEALRMADSMEESGSPPKCRCTEVPPRH